MVGPLARATLVCRGHHEDEEDDCGHDHQFDTHVTTAAAGSCREGAA
jgi:hypothetical protein